MGLKFTRTTDSWQWDVAYFFQPEPEGPPAAFGTGGPGRYSYDVIPREDASLTERNQFNILGAYQLENGEVGASAQFGQLYNTSDNETNGKYAVAAHADFTFGNFCVMPQVLYYGMDAVNDDGDDLITVFMGAYAIPYEVSLFRRNTFSK